MSNTRLVVLVMLLGTFAFGQGKQPPVFKVSGKVQGYLPPEAVTLELLGGIHRTDPSRTLFDVNTGEFAILNVAPGEYRLRARQEKMRGEVKVSIGSTDVSGLSIALLLPRTVLGAMRSVGSQQKRYLLFWGVSHSRT